MRCCFSCHHCQQLPCVVGLLLLLLLPPLGELQVYGTSLGHIQPLTRLGWGCGS